jgi:hypothetical protein
LPENIRAGVQYHVPLEFNYGIASQNGQARPQGIQRRSRWAYEHTQYLRQLIEFAMITLNRPVEYRDFPAITEALHRNFRGTTSGNIPYLERGYRTVHSHAIREEHYDALVRRMFPEQRRNRSHRPTRQSGNDQQI